jgi:hypothetical protein
MSLLGREVISYDCGRDQGNEVLPLVVSHGLSVGAAQFSHCCDYATNWTSGEAGFGSRQIFSFLHSILTNTVSLLFKEYL